MKIVRGHKITVALSEEQRDALKVIRDRIQQGYELPPWAYRVNRDSSPDDLLEREGIMHLHLSPLDRDATLFLIQYRDHVLFLDVTNHSTFRDDPPGSSLYNLHRNAIAMAEEALDAEHEEKKITVAAGLKRRTQRDGSSS